jgi:hypothetical protein
MGLTPEQLAPGESITGYFFPHHIPPAAWQLDTCGGLWTSWLVNTIAIIEQLMIDAGVTPHQGVHLTFSHDLRPDPYDLFGTLRPVIMFDAMGLTAHRPTPAVRARSPEQLRTLLEQDKLSYGCQCRGALPFRLVPTEIPDRYAVQQLHEHGCPAPARMKNRPNVAAN